MNSRIEKLHKKYVAVCNEYIENFCKKHDCYFEFWVADEVGGVASFGDINYFNFGDIVYDLNTDQPKGQIFTWSAESIDNPKKSINYFSYCLGLRHEQI